MKGNVYGLSGFIVIGFALLLFLIAIVGLMDPVGTQMADDNAPFGPRLAEIYITFWFIVALLAFPFGIWLLKLADRQQSSATKS